MKAPSHSRTGRERTICLIVPALCLTAVIGLVAWKWKLDVYTMTTVQRRNELSQKTAELRQKQSEVKTDQADRERTTPPSDKKLSASALPSAAPQVVASFSVFTGKLSHSDWKLVRNDPELVANYARYRLAAFQSAYAPVLRELQLTSEQVEKLCDASIAFDHRWGELVERGFPSQTAQQESRKELTAALESSKVAILGEAGNKVFSNFHRSMDARQVARQWSANALMAGIFVESDRVEKLGTAIAESSATYQRGHSSNLTQTDWTRLDAAREILTPEQFVYFANTDAPIGSVNRWFYEFSKAMYIQQNPGMTTFGRPLGSPSANAGR